MMTVTKERGRASEEKTLEPAVRASEPPGGALNPARRAPDPTGRLLDLNGRVLDPAGRDFEPARGLQSQLESPLGGRGACRKALGVGKGGNTTKIPM